jgi:predicted patatin/cPLA2 family phospholipase
MIIVRTRDASFRKKPSSHFEKMTYRRVYKDYPAFIQTGINRPLVYNQQVSGVADLVRDGNALCIAPQQPVKVSRLEYNTKKLTTLYLQGRKDGQSQTKAIRKFLADKAY